MVDADYLAGLPCDNQTLFYVYLYASIKGLKKEKKTARQEPLCISCIDPKEVFIGLQEYVHTYINKIKNKDIGAKGNVSRKNKLKPREIKLGPKIMS